MEEKKDILNNLKKSAKPDIPKDFFVDFSSNLMKKIDQNQDNDSLLDQIHKTSKPEIPIDFFNEFSKSIVNHVKEPKKKRSRIIKISSWSTVISVAAILAVLVWINKDEEGEMLADTGTESINDSMNDEDYFAYLSYVDENEIVDFMIDNEVEYEVEESNEGIDEVYDYLGDDLEELYLEL